MSFLLEFIKTPRVVGAIAPSSQALAREMCIRTNVSESENILELGPGTGAFTGEILRQKSQQSQFAAIEFQEKFVRLLEQKFEGMTVFHGDAGEQIESRYHEDSIDCIVSGLPWAVFDQKYQKKTLSLLHSRLSPTGTFSTFAYAQSPYLPSGRSFRKIIDGLFSSVTVSPLIVRNFPPAYIFTMQK